MGGLPAALLEGNGKEPPVRTTASLPPPFRPSNYKYIIRPTVRPPGIMLSARLLPDSVFKSGPLSSHHPIRTRLPRTTTPTNTLGLPASPPLLPIYQHWPSLALCPSPTLQNASAPALLAPLALPALTNHVSLAHASRPRPCPCGRRRLLPLQRRRQPGGCREEL